MRDFFTALAILVVGSGYVNAGTFKDESCITSNMQKLYNRSDIDEKIQSLRDIQISSKDKEEVRRARLDEEKLDRELMKLAMRECKKSKGNLLFCEGLPTPGYPELEIVSEKINGKDYIVTYLISNKGNRMAVESYPDKKGEGDAGISKPSFHQFKIGDGADSWQLVNYKNAFPAAGDSWDFIRVGGHGLTSEEKKKYPSANNPNPRKLLSAFYNMKCEESVPERDETEVSKKVVDESRKAKVLEDEGKGSRSFKGSPGRIPK
ncbi:MAG: hypothetical protein CME70_11525 [Halobacteriovorax sp.]|nr:hypothetical protein [Halobacteriovorax sp.]|tara:strand:- start:52104 stop:52892 length:789 start_codon:yes stop_codon:yes gene_type:complete